MNGRFNNHIGELLAHTHTSNWYSCRTILGGGGEAHYTYRYTTEHDYVIDRAAASISAANLAQGEDFTPTTSLYAVKLNRREPNFVPGMIFGDKLGGMGSDPANIFPQSLDGQTKLRTFEDRIYHCLEVSAATASALLRVEFKYRSVTDTRPFSLYYTVTFQGNSKCRSTVLTLDN